MNESLDCDWDWTSGKNKTFTPKHLLKTLYFSLFNSNLMHRWLIWGEDQKEKFKKSNATQKQTEV